MTLPSLIKTVLHPYIAWYKLGGPDVWLIISMVATFSTGVWGVPIFIDAKPAFIIATFLMGYIPSLIFYAKFMKGQPITWPERLYVLLSSGYVIGLTIGWLISLYK